MKNYFYRRIFRILAVTFLLMVMNLPVKAQWSQVWGNIDGINIEDFTGYSVSLSGDGLKVAIGEIGGDGNSLTNCGRVRVFLNNGSAWIQQGQTVYGSANNDHSAKSVSLSSDGTTLAMAASDNPGGGFFRGQIRVFQWNPGSSTWDQKGSDINGTINAIQFGYSISLSLNGNILAVGAPSHPGGGLTRGQVKVYEWNGGAWNQLGNPMDGEYDLDFSGWSVSLSADGHTVAIGAPQNDAGSPISTNPGHVRVYRFDGTAWNQLGSDIDGLTVGSNGDNLGQAVSLSANGETIAIGAPAHNGGMGRVQAFYLDATNQWQQLGLDLSGTPVPSDFPDYYGHSVSLSADGLTIAVGAFQHSNLKGYVLVYSYITDALGTSWRQQGSAIDGEEDGDYFGYSVSLTADGKAVAIGAFESSAVSVPDSGRRGRVQVFEHLSAFRTMQNLINSLNNLPGGIRNALLNKLTDGVEKYCNGNKNAALNKIIALINQLRATTIHIVLANPARASQLLSLARDIYREMETSTFNCPPSSLKIELPVLSIRNTATSIFPNPAIQEAWLDLSGYNHSSSSVRLMDLRGGQFKEWRVEKGDHKILNMNLTGLPSGMYFVHIRAEGQRPETLKLLVK